MKALNNNLSTQTGMAALLTVVIIGAVALVIVRSPALLGLGEIGAVYTASQGKAALGLAHACANEVLRQWRQDENYSAIDRVLNIGDGECLVNTSAQGNERQATIRAALEDYYQTIEINVILESNAVVLNSWQRLNN